MRWTWRRLCYTATSSMNPNCMWNSKDFKFCVRTGNWTQVTFGEGQSTVPTKALAISNCLYLYCSCQNVLVVNLRHFQWPNKDWKWLWIHSNNTPNKSWRLTCQLHAIWSCNMHANTVWEMFETSWNLHSQQANRNNMCCHDHAWHITSNVTQNIGSLRRLSRYKVFKAVAMLISFFFGEK